MERSDLHRQLVDGCLLQLGHWEGRLHWSYGVMHELVREAPELAWPIICELAERADDEQLGNLGSGILEDFVAGHGRQFIDRIEERAPVSPRFRLAFQNVWRNATPTDVWARIVPLLDDRPAGAEGLPFEMSHWLELQVTGLPPGAPGSADEVEARRLHLLQTIRDEDRRPERAPFTTPVAVRLDIEPGSGTIARLDVVSILDSVVDTISADRQGADAANLAGVALIASRDLVWEVEAIRIRRPVEMYRLRVSSMSEDQVEVFDSRNADEVSSLE